VGTHLVISEPGAKTVKLMPSPDFSVPYIHVDTDPESGQLYLLHWDGSAWFMSEGYIESRAGKAAEWKLKGDSKQPYSPAVFAEVLDKLLR
jgi:hypothetical protein